MIANHPLYRLKSLSRRFTRTHPLTLALSGGSYLFAQFFSSRFLPFLHRPLGFLFWVHSLTFKIGAKFSTRCLSHGEYINSLYIEL